MKRLTTRLAVNKGNSCATLAEEGVLLTVLGPNQPVDDTERDALSRNASLTGDYVIESCLGSWPE